MKLLVGLSVLGCVMVAAPAYAAELDPEAAQFTCNLTGECDAVADPGAEPDPAAAVPANPRGPRGSATRGFSFQRAEQPGAPTRIANAPIASPAAVRQLTRPVQVGSADLGLSFLPSSATLTEPAKARLAKYAAALSSPKLINRRLRIEGHTDANGSMQANAVLSRRRAQSVADFLVQAGIERNRLEVMGYGASRPLPGVQPQAAANRRVVAVLL